MNSANMAPRSENRRQRKHCMIKRAIQILIICGSILFLLERAMGIEKGKEEYFGTYIYEYKKPPQWGSPPHHYIYILEIKEDGSYRLTSGTITSPEWQYLWKPDVQGGDWKVETKEEQEREMRQLGIPKEEMGRIEEIIWFSPPLPVEPAPVGGVWSLVKKGNKLISPTSTIEFFPQTANIAFVKKESIEEIEEYRRQIESTAKVKDTDKVRKRHITGYTEELASPKYLLALIRNDVLKCPKESCNDYEKEAAKVLIGQLLTREQGEWLSWFLLKSSAKKLFFKMILGESAIVAPIVEEKIKEGIEKIKEKLKTDEKKIEVYPFRFYRETTIWENDILRDIWGAIAYFPYEDRDGRERGGEDGEAWIVFNSPHPIPIKEIKKQVSLGGFAPSIELKSKADSLPEEGIVRPFGLFIGVTVYEMGSVSKYEITGDVVYGPEVVFLEKVPTYEEAEKDKFDFERVFGRKVTEEVVGPKDISVKPIDPSSILGKWVPESESKVHGKHVSTLEFRKDGTVISTMTYSGKWEVKRTNEIVLSHDPQFFPDLGSPAVETYQIDGDALKDSFGNVFMKDKDAQVIKQTIRGKIWDRYVSSGKGIKREVKLKNEGAFLSTLYLSEKWETDGKVVKVYTPEGKESPWLYEIKGEKIEVKLKDTPNMSFVPFVRQSMQKVTEGRE